jgi:hypothetical protein
MPKEDKNQNGKRHTEMNLTGKKDRNLSKKRDKINKLQKVPEGTSQRHFAKVKQYSYWDQYNHSVDPPEWVERHLWFATRPLDHAIMDRTKLMKASRSLQEICCQVIYLSHRAMH